MPNTPDTQKEEIFAIQNIFGKPPGWLVNWGITAAFLFLIVCLGIAAFVKYPDKLVMLLFYFQMSRIVKDRHIILSIPISK